MKKINWKNIMKAMFICFVLSLFLCCGYTFAPQGEYIDKRIQKVYIESFGNKTPQAEIENYVRTAFINQFIQYSRLKVVGSVEDADATVKGNVINFNTVALSYRANTLAAEERATVTLELTFRERESGKIIWNAKNIQGTVEYKLEDDINLFPITRKNALTKLANDTAEKAFNLMMAGF
jgi:Lipopolysaccharide-assembly